MKKTTSNIIILCLLILIIGMSFWIYNLTQNNTKNNKNRKDNIDTITIIDSLHSFYAPYVYYSEAMSLYYVGKRTVAEDILKSLATSDDSTIQIIAKLTLNHQILKDNSTSKSIVNSIPEYNQNIERDPKVIELQDHNNTEDRTLDEKNNAGTTMLNLVSKKGKKFEYIGAIQNHMATGFGVGVYETGSIYKGYWKSNMKHGEGIFTWKDGERYEGKFINDLRDGHGKYTWTNGEYYIGAWKADQRNGKGILYRKNGKIKKEGIWENDEFVKGEKHELQTPTM